MTLLLFYGILALVVPYAIFAWFHRGTTLVFQGNVPISTIGLLPRERRTVTAYDFLTAFMPDGGHLVFEVSKERLAKLPSLFSEAYITVVQPMFGERYVSSVRFASEKEGDSKAGDTKYVGLYLAVTYLMLAMLAAGFVAQPANAALLGHFGNAYVGLLTVVSGWMIAKYQMKPVAADAEFRFLGFKMGKGRLGLLAVTLVAAVISGACFWYGGLLVLVGLNTGMALGSLMALMVKPEAKATT